MANGDAEHLELGVADGARAQAFFSTLLGWSFDEMGGGNGRTTGAAVPVGVHPGDLGGGFQVYFTVADLDAAVTTVRELGGTAGAIQDGGAFGRFAACGDGQGTTFALRQPGTS